MPGDPTADTEDTASGEDPRTIFADDTTKEDTAG